MSKKLYEESNISAIADAIRVKNGGSSKYTVGQMPTAIREIKTQPDLEELNATENGAYTPSSGKDGFSSVLVNVQSSGGSAILVNKSISSNGVYNALVDDEADGYSEVVVNVPSSGSNIKYAGDAYFGNYDGSSTSALGCNIHGAIGAYAVLVIMHRDTITLPSGWMLIDHRINPKTSATGNINQELSIYKKQMTAASETVIINQASSARMCATSFIFGSDVNISYLQTLEMDDYSEYRYTVPSQNNPVLFCMSNPYAGYGNADFSPGNITIGQNGVFSNVNNVTIRHIASIINSPIDSIFLFSTSAQENDKAINRAYLYSLS